MRRVHEGALSVLALWPGVHLRLYGVVYVFWEEQKGIYSTLGKFSRKDFIYGITFFNLRGTELLSLLCLYARKPVTLKGQLLQFWFGPCSC